MKEKKIERLTLFYHVTLPRVICIAVIMCECMHVCVCGYSVPSSVNKLGNLSKYDATMIKVSISAVYPATLVSGLPSGKTDC